MEFSAAPSLQNRKKAGVLVLPFWKTDKGVAKGADFGKFEGEIRWLRTGIVDGAFVTVVWTIRGDRIRLISFRRARREERRAYLDSHI